MTIKSILKLFCLGFLTQILVLETANAAEYCRSRRTYRRSGQNVHLFYDVRHPAARTMCDSSGQLYSKRRTGRRLFHPIPINQGNATATPTGSPASFLGPTSTAPLFNSNGSVVDFMSAYQRNSPHRSRRLGNLHAWPEYRRNGQTQLACGSEHIRRQRSRAYMHPTSACMLAGVAQEWRRTVCPNNTPDCQLRFGDMTYGNSQPGHWPHASHRRGWCVDVWPIRKPGHSGDVVVGQNAYDRDRTRHLVQVMQKWGGATPTGRNGSNQIFFDDPILIRAGLTRPLRRTHLDHIHVCFKPTSASESRCRQTRFDAGLCPGIGANGAGRETPTSSDSQDPRSMM